MICTKIYCAYVILCLYLELVKAEISFDVKADELMDSILKDVYRGKYDQKLLTHESVSKASTPKFANNFYEKQSNISAVDTNLPIRKYAKNMTRDEFHMRKRQLDIKTIIEEEYHLPEFKSNEDEMTSQYRRFNHIKKSGSDGLRELYFADMNVEFEKMGKTRAISLMAQFVYEIRYHLPYAQLMRRKYKANVKYQLGYCFALLKRLKRQQMMIHSTLTYMTTRFLHLYSHLKLYEKIVRLDVDIKELIRFIIVLHKLKEERIKSTERTPSTMYGYVGP